MGYSEERNELVKTSGDTIIKYSLSSEKIREKYLFSFDGKKSWYGYKGGRWILATQNFEPSIDETEEYGMTSDEINNLKPNDFNKIYANNAEVYTLNMAIGMKSASEYVTPVVKGITLNTIANQAVDSIFSSKITTYNKNDYNKIDRIFPIEDFKEQAECYYFLYLGNDWIYTYKNNKVVKLLDSAEHLFSDIPKNWLELKQYGMTAKEIRNIPSEILTKLFVNVDFANSEFGVISVINAKDSTTQNYKTDIRLQGNSNYFNEDNLVLEIVLNSNDKKVFFPKDITKSQIDDFMSWIDQRQQGNGNIFYHLKTAKQQSFINYYTITSINVFNETDYNAMQKQQQITPTTEPNTTDIQ